MPDFAVPFLLLAAVWWLAAACAVGAAAEARGRSKGAWLGVALLLGPVVAPLILACYPLREREELERLRAGNLSITG